MSYRLKFFFSHLSISLCIALMSICLVFILWYPAPLHTAVGVFHIFFILLFVDTSLGPLLTLVIAHPKKHKKKLMQDLIVIATLQICALMYGLYKIEEGRPIWIAFDTYRFEIVQSPMIDPSAPSKDDIYNHPPLFSKPSFISITPPNDDDEKNDRLFYQLEKGIAPTARPMYYRPIEKAWAQMSKEAKPLDDLNQFNTPDKAKSILSRYPSANRYLPLLSPQVDMTVLVDTEQKEILGIVDLRPW